MEIILSLLFVISTKAIIFKILDKYKYFNRLIVKFILEDNVNKKYKIIGLFQQDYIHLNAIILN